MDSNEKQLMRFLLRYPPHVISQLDIDPNPGTLYHISPNPDISEFSPRRIQRIVHGEDELVPRICTAISLLDCLRGYAVSLSDFLKKKANCAGDDQWLGGYIIYAVDHQGSLIPSPMMAPIAKWCEERWLVDHEQENQIYPARKIGKMFINEITIKGEKEQRVIETQLLIEVSESVDFMDGKTLTPGKYRVAFDSLQRYGKEMEFKPIIEKIDNESYKAAKERRAHLLSYDNGHSAIKGW